MDDPRLVAARKAYHDAYWEPELRDQRNDELLAVERLVKREQLEEDMREIERVGWNYGKAQFSRPQGAPK